MPPSPTRPLGKTAQRILLLLQQRGTVSVTRVGGHGPQGGSKTSGQREMRAARHLIDAGLAVQRDYYRSVEPRNGYTMRYSTLTLVLPPTASA